MVRRPGALSFVLGLLIGLPATGCSDSDKAATLPSATPRPSTSATGSEFPKTPEGAAAFARHYWRLYNTATSGAHIDTFEAAGQPNCRSCRNILAFLKDIYGAGGRLEGSTVEVEHAAAPAFTGSSATVSLIVDQERGTVFDSDGRVQRRIPPAEAFDSEMTLHWTTAGWLVQTISQFGAAE